MTSDRILSQHEPEDIARARRALDDVLAGPAGTHCRLAVGAALAVLSDVSPPYPPLPESTCPQAEAVGVAAARSAMAAAAVRPDASIEETLRIARALRELNELDLFRARPESA